MKIKLFSDIHTEFDTDEGLDFFKSQNLTDVDVLIMAGDIFMLKKGTEYPTQCIQALFDIKPDLNIIYVPGNHEYYNSNPVQVSEHLDALSDGFNKLHILNSRLVTIKGQKFIGGTMWFPFNYKAGQYKENMSDFRVIKNFEPWVYEENFIFMDYLGHKCDSNTVVVTHHLPTEYCVAEQYKGSPLNPFFVCECLPLIKNMKPKLWMYGHTHTGNDFTMENTRFVCNPRGYYFEPESRKTFNHNLIIEI